MYSNHCWWTRWRTSPLGEIREYLCVWPQIDSWVHLLYNGMMVGNKKGRRYLQTIFGWPKRSLKMALLEHNLRVIFQSIWGFLTMWGKVLSKQDNILQILLLKQNTISYCFLIYWEILLFSFFLHNYCIINHFMLFENKEWETFLLKVTLTIKSYIAGYHKPLSLRKSNLQLSKMKNVPKTFLGLENGHYHRFISLLWPSTFLNKDIAHLFKKFIL